MKAPVLADGRLANLSISTVSRVLPAFKPDKAGDDPRAGAAERGDLGGVNEPGEYEEGGHAIGVPADRHDEGLDGGSDAPGHA
jgi:hypothetical protein